MRAAIVSIGDPVIVFLNVVPYVGAWWLALRIVFGKRLQPLEWIPLGIAAFGIPEAMLDFVRPERLAEALAGAWEALPIPIILTEAIMQWRRS